MRPRCRSGVSLIEIMVAVAILASFLLPTFHLLVSFTGASRQQKVEGLAANLAKEEMNWWLYVASASYYATAVDLSKWNTRLGTVEIDGNQVELAMKVRRHEGTRLVMNFPVFQWHDFVNGGGGYGPCRDGIEQRVLASGTDVTIRTERLDQLSPERARQVDFYDLLLRVRWKLPTEADYAPANTRYLLSRRAILP
jgi:prepilin-type N-terminal cleavage/methylation domain-containing protein